MTLAGIQRCACGQPATVLRAARWTCWHCTPRELPTYEGRRPDPEPERIRHLEALIVAFAEHHPHAAKDIEAEGRAIMERDKA